MISKWTIKSWSSFSVYPNGINSTLFRDWNMLLAVPTAPKTAIAKVTFSLVNNSCMKLKIACIIQPLFFGILKIITQKGVITKMKLFKPRWVVRICIHKNQDKSDMDNLQHLKEGYFFYWNARKEKKRISDIPVISVQICHIPFRKRHPYFPLWLSIFALIAVTMNIRLDSCIRHILQIMQVWR